MFLDGQEHGKVVPLRRQNDPNGHIHVRGTKTANADRKVQLAPALKDELVALFEAREEPDPGQRVFGTTGPKGRLNESNVRNRILAPAIERANVVLIGAEPPIVNGITPHSLRRTYASMLAKRGEDPATMMDQMGHSDAQFTFSVYAKAGDADREAWEALWQGSFGQPAGNRTPEADSGDAAEEAV